MEKTLELIFTKSDGAKKTLSIADPDRLRQVFINIMDNAIKYSAPGGRITVKL